jgi:hypothetical protein
MRIVAVVAEEMRLRPREQRCALVDLIERIRHHDQRRACRVDHGLREREQSFARAVHRNQHRFGIHGAGGQAETSRQPSGRSRSELRHAGSRRVAAEAGEIRSQRIQHELRRWMARLAYRHGNVRQLRWRLRTGEQCAQALERVRP